MKQRYDNSPPMGHFQEKAGGGRHGPA